MKKKPVRTPKMTLREFVQRLSRVDKRGWEICDGCITRREGKRIYSPLTAVFTGVHGIYLRPWQGEGAGELLGLSDSVVDSIMTASDWAGVMGSTLALRKKLMKAVGL